MDGHGAAMSEADLSFEARPAAEHLRMTVMDWRMRLPPHPSTIDGERLPGDERGVVAGQERHRADQILWHLHPLDGLHLGHALELLVHALEAGARRPRQRARRASESGRDGV